MIRRRLAAVCVVVAGLTLTACTSSGSDTTGSGKSTGGQASTHASAAVNPASIKSQPSAGCSSTAAAASSGNETFAVPGGKTGVYIQDIPSNYAAGTPSPVVFDLHGLGENAQIEHIATTASHRGSQHRTTGEHLDTKTIDRIDTQPRAELVECAA